MNLKQLACFEAVARHLHFTRAAEELVHAQPALSLHIRRLEAELGTPLFDRTTRNVRLTYAGEMLLPYAQRILAEVKDAQAYFRDLQALEAGRLTICAQQSLNASGVLPRVLAEFRDRYPAIDVVLREGDADEAWSTLLDGGSDVALIHVYTHGESDKVEELEELVYHPLLEEPVVFIAAIDRGFSSVTHRVAEFADEPFIAFNQSAGLRHMLMHVCADAGFEPRIAYESSSLGSIRSLVSAGLGIALMPLPAAQQLGPPVQIVATDVQMRRTITLVHHRHRYQSAAARALSRLLIERLAPETQRDTALAAT